MCVYISPICNVETRLIFSVEIIKLGILSFLSSHGIRAKGENLIYFFSDRVSFRSPSPPPDLLLTAAVTAVGDFPGSSSPTGNHRFQGARGRSTCRWQPRRQPATPPATSNTRAVMGGLPPAACRPRAGT